MASAPKKPRIAQASRQLNVFLCFAPEDTDLCTQLKNHMTYLRDVYRLSICSNELEGGSPLQKTWTDLLRKADLVLLLMSADFLASKECSLIMKEALELEKDGRTTVASIMLRSVFAPQSPFANSQILPDNQKPITEWQNQDRAFYNVCDGINEIILGINRSRASKNEAARRAFAAREQQRLQSELRVSNRDTRANPNDANAYINKGRILYELGRFRKAIPVLKKAIRLNPNAATAYLYKGSALTALKRFKKALPDLKKAIDLDPYNPAPHFIKARALYKLGQFEAALPDLKEALRLSPHLDIAPLLEGEILRVLGRFEAALPELKLAIDLNPANKNTSYHEREMLFWSYAASNAQYPALILLALLLMAAIIAIFYLLITHEGLIISFTYYKGSNPTSTISSTGKRLPHKHTNPTPTPAASEEARAVIQQLYNAVNKRDYQTAYYLWQSNRDGTGKSYADFVRDYSNTLRDDIKFASVTQEDDQTVAITITVYATERGQNHTYQEQYIVKLVDGSWLITNGTQQLIT